MLDVPEPSYVSAVQSLLSNRDSWRMTAEVIGTVATLNHSKTDDPEGYKIDFGEFCSKAKATIGSFTGLEMFNGYWLVLLDHPSPGDQTSQYIGMPPAQSDTCEEVYDHLQLLTVNRQQCQGTWSITRSGIELVNGTCSGHILSEEKQLVITGNNLYLGTWYMPSLTELLSPFVTTRTQSDWRSPYLATATAAMMWSRILACSNGGCGVTLNGTSESIGAVYSVKDEVLYVRPTVRKSWLLYGILALQPFLTLVMVALKTIFYSTPLDKGFGLVSILSGIDHSSLNSLSGATLSGELSRTVNLVMYPVQKGDKNRIEYHIRTDSDGSKSNRQLSSQVNYY
jgi:hypothetical protein